MHKESSLSKEIWVLLLSKDSLWLYSLPYVTAQHLSRTACLYVQQSTLQQVLENTESGPLDLAAAARLRAPAPCPVARAGYPPALAAIFAIGKTDPCAGPSCLFLPTPVHGESGFRTKTLWQVAWSPAQQAFPSRHALFCGQNDSLTPDFSGHHTVNYPSAPLAVDSCWLHRKLRGYSKSKFSPVFA